MNEYGRLCAFLQSPRGGAPSASTGYIQRKDNMMHFLFTKCSALGTAAVAISA
jgi:hypothetical protein